MIQWEYKRETCNWPMQDLDELLKKRGEMGWELVVDHDVHNDDCEHRLTFKRPKK